MNDASSRAWRFWIVSFAAVAVAVGAGWAIGKFRSRGADATPDPNEEILLRDAGFTDLRGIDPPSLVLTDADGKEAKLSDFKGRTILLHFWGIDCVHCLKEMPRIQELETGLLGRPFVALHVCTDADNAKQAQEIAGRAVPGLRVFTDMSGLGLARFEIQALPMVWLIGPDGKAIGRASGTRDWTATPLLRLIESAITGIKPASG